MEDGRWSRQSGRGGGRVCRQRELNMSGLPLHLPLLLLLSTSPHLLHSSPPSKEVLPTSTTEASTNSTVGGKREDHLLVEEEKEEMQVKLKQPDKSKEKGENEEKWEEDKDYMEDEERSYDEEESDEEEENDEFEDEGEDIFPDPDSVIDYTVRLAGWFGEEQGVEEEGRGEGGGEGVPWSITVPSLPPVLRLRQVKAIHHHEKDTNGANAICGICWLLLRFGNWKK